MATRKLPTVASASVHAAAAARLRGAALVLAAGALWSSGGTLVRLVEAADARQIVFWRSFFVALFVLGVLLARRRARGAVAAFRALGWDGPLAGACLAGAFWFFIEALTRTEVANAVFVLAAQPLLAALLGRLLLGERVRPATWAALAAAAVGVAVMVAPGLGRGGLAGGLLAFGSASGFALFSVALRRGAPAVDRSPAILYGALLSALVAVALLVPSGGLAALALAPRDLALCAAMGTASIGLGMLAYAAGARHLPAAELALLALSEVVLAPVWAWLVLGEVPRAATLAGGAVVLAAAVAQALAGAGRRGGPVAANRPPPRDRPPG